MHTPGPWIITEEKPSGTDPLDLGGYRINGDGGRIEQIAFVWHASMRYLSDEKFGSERGLADAKLIAAAPEMLAALQKVAPFLKHGNDAEGRLRAIIDKAIVFATTRLPETVQ
jgi:hypothetical protein